ncbi:SIMPL domain-containing protein [Streptomyces stramineus]
MTITTRNTDRTTALQDLTRRNNQALELLRSYGNTIEKLETGTFTVIPQFADKGRSDRVRSYHGSIHLTATLSDFTTLGELATRLADLENTRIDGPWWALRPDSPAHRTARTQAVQEAVQRAREYAEALGAHLVALTELADDTTDHYPSAGAAAGMTRTAGYGGPDPTPALDLEPQRQTVSAQVNARFTMTRPQL